MEYNGQTAVEAATLSIYPRDYLGIVGPSGSGKTSLLKTLAGTISPGRGSVSRKERLRVGYVPQVETVNWFFPVTVLEVVLMGGDSRRPVPWPARWERKRAEAHLERLGLGDLKRRHIRALSGGQQARVFVARSLMGDPDVLLLDEPTAGVDVATRHEVLHLLHDLNHDEGIAVVITTHDLNGIAAHMHTVVCLNRRIIAAGAPAEILTPGILEETYGAPMDVLSHGGMPVVVEHFETPATSSIGDAHHEHAPHEHEHIHDEGNH
ncbi:MAG: metal ABC transporter ATP-binding protein [Acidimicrobiia bacterium]